MTNHQDTIARLRVIQSQFERIAAKHPNDQPSYSDGVRPFGTGDLRHFIEALEIAAAALSVPNHSSVGREAVALAICNEQRRFNGYARFLRLTDMDPHHYRDQLRYADAILALLPSVPAGVSEDDEQCNCGLGKFSSGNHSDLCFFKARLATPAPSTPLGQVDEQRARVFVTHDDALLFTNEAFRNIDIELSLEDEADILGALQTTVDRLTAFAKQSALTSNEQRGDREASATDPVKETGR